MAKYFGPMANPSTPDVGDEFLQRQLDAQQQLTRTPVQGAIPSARQMPMVPSLETEEQDIPEVSPRSMGTANPYSGFEYGDDTTEEELDAARNREESLKDYWQGPERENKIIDNAEAGFDQEIRDEEGNLVGVDKLRQMNQEEREAQYLQNLGLQNAIQAKNEYELEDAFGGRRVQAKGADLVVNASRDFASALNNIKVKSNDSIHSGETTNALSAITTAFHMTNAEAAQTAGLVFTMGLPLAIGSTNARRRYEKAKNKDTEPSPEDDLLHGLDYMEGINALMNTGLTESEDVDLSANDQLNPNTMSRSGMAAILGKAFTKLATSKNAVDPNTGLPLDKSLQFKPTMQPQETGELILQAMINSGYLMPNYFEGKEVVDYNPLTGVEFFLKTKELNSELTGAMYGRAQKVPVGQFGDYIGALRNTRPGDIKRRGSQRISPIDEAKRIAGSIAKIPSDIKGFFGAQLFKVLLEQIQNGGKPVNGIDALPFFKISHETLQKALQGGGINPRSREKNNKEIINKLNLLASELFYQAGFMADGTPIYTAYKEDPMVHRLYQDTIDQNEQRNKWTRAVMNYVTVPYKLSKTNYHMTGMTQYEAGLAWAKIGDKVRKKDFSLTDEEREVSFLAILGRALNAGANLQYNVGNKLNTVTKSENLTIPSLLSLVTPEFIKNAADIGRALATIVPGTSKDRINDMLNTASAVDKALNNNGKRIPGDASKATPSAFNSLNEQQLNAVKTWLDNSDRETWGYTLQAYLDAADYLDAKINNKPFKPKTTVAIDMNSAGRTFMATDVGNMDILKRVGVLWDYYTDAELQDVMGIHGDPRSFFTETAHKAGVSAAISDLEKKQAWENALKKYGSKGVKGYRAFNSLFAKKVLLTTNYGMPMQYHLAEARAFLLDENNSGFLKDMMGAYGDNLIELVKDTNEVIYHTLRQAGDAWQFSTPKQMAIVLQMANRSPHPDGKYGEKIPVGLTSPEETGEYTTYEDEEGVERVVYRTRSKHDPHAAAKHKLVMNEKGELQSHQPGPGTAAPNQMGPIIGQYRESLALTEIMNYINGGKSPSQMRNMSPVFDNLILDADSYLQTLYVANNIVVPKVMEWNLPESFVKDYAKQLKEAESELMKMGNSVIVGPKSQWRGFTNVIDTYYERYSKINPNKLNDNQKMFLKYFNDEKTSGYKKPSEDRPEMFSIHPQQLIVAMRLMARNFNISIDKEGNPTGNLHKWVSGMKGEKEKRIREIRDMARRGMIYFFT